MIYSVEGIPKTEKITLPSGEEIQINLKTQSSAASEDEGEVEDTPEEVRLIATFSEMCAAPMRLAVHCDRRHLACEVDEASRSREWHCAREKREEEEARQVSWQVRPSASYVLSFPINFIFAR